MATSEQLKALLKSYIEADESRFLAIAMQIAAHEARIGHGEFAKELRQIIDDAKIQSKRSHFSKEPIPITQPKGELSSLLTTSFPKIKLSDMILDSDISDRLTRIIKEQRQITKLRSYGLSPRRKFLLLGPPGTGKTMTASALAGELNLSLFVIRLEGVITKYMGETSAKLRLVFDAISQYKGVYLFDEFDSIGTMRGAINDVGEMRRILNSFLQFIDQDNSDSLILAGSNHFEILDYALFRRFDDVIQYKLPNKTNRIQILKNRLAMYQKHNINWERLADAASKLSYAEITRACEDAAKDMIIHDRKKITNDVILQMLSERNLFHNKEDLK
jgi:SpoVK/Ycf46/Vps4 family AAA+-type ATPase